jgi:bacterioferritin (cytochrome b1)
MVTLVGTQEDFLDALKEFLELEYNTVETYTAAIDRVDEQAVSEKLKTFRRDHEQLIKNIINWFEQHGQEVSKGPSGKQILDIGAVSISKLLGDKAILKKISQMEEDVKTACERLFDYDDKPQDINNVLNDALSKVEEHDRWLNSLKLEE